MVDVNGQLASGIIIRDTTGSVGDNPKLGLRNVVCDLRSGTVVAILGREKSADDGEGLYLVSLTEMCKAEGRFVREIYVNEFDVKLSPSNALDDTTIIAKSASNSDQQTTTGMTTSTDTGSYPPSTPDTGEGKTTMSGCQQVGLIGFAFDTTTPLKPAQKNPGDLCTKNCGIPGQYWRQGGLGSEVSEKDFANNYALEVSGQAQKLNFSVKRRSSMQCSNSIGTDLGNMSEIAKNAKNEAGCTKDWSKTLLAANYAVATKKDTYLIPLKDFVIPNNWIDAEIQIDVTALDTYDKPINTCTQELRTISPIVLDFTKEARLATTSLSSSHVRFDHRANGEKLRTGWISGKRGFLAIDLNRDGVINDGSELFGEGTKLLNSGAHAGNGYIALQQYDTAKLGYIDDRNSVFERLLVWFDRNQDGISQNDELVSASKLGITRIDTDYHEAPQFKQESRLAFENQVKWRSKFYDRDTCRAGCYSYDVYFATERVRFATNSHDKR